MVNGAVLENGDRRSRLNILTSDANVLRLKDAIHPHEVNTPVKRVCYITQLVLAGEAEPNEAETQVLRGIEQLLSVFHDSGSQEILSTAAHFVREGKYYQAMKSLKGLLPREQVLMKVERG
jgi:flagellar protein FlbT